MLVITRAQLFAYRARRQYLASEPRGRTPEDVLGIIKALQPYPPVAGSMPGSPPQLRHRVVGFEDEWSGRWRAQGRIVKGRFNRGNVSYVAREDLAMYAAAFRRSMRDPMPQPARSILGVLKRQGPMPKSALRELTSLERGPFNQALTALYRAFEVMELQREVDWDSMWDVYRRAFPDADRDAWGQGEAQGEVLIRFTRAFGPATVVEMRTWSAWPKRRVQEIVDLLLRSGALVKVEVEGRSEPAYLACEDLPNLEGVEPVTSFLVVLPANDPLVIPQALLLKTRYRSEKLPYCLGVFVEDGEIVGSAWGQYKRRYAHIEMLDLEPDIVYVPPRIDKALAALEAHVSGGRVPIWIYGINGPPDAPWTDEILTRNGYVWREGYYVKEAGAKGIDTVV